jgi:hypothetical protein
MVSVKETTSELFCTPGRPRALLIDETLVEFNGYKLVALEEVSPTALLGGTCC